MDNKEKILQLMSNLESENIERINELLTYMMENGITLENPEDFDV